MANPKDKDPADCTATLIAPNLVLTARHCVSKMKGREGCKGGFKRTLPPKGIRVSTATRTESVQKWYGAEKIYLPSSPEKCGADIALVRLESKVPSSKAKPYEPRLEAQVQKNEGYSAIGFGQTENFKDEGIRRRVDGKYVKCVGTNCPPRAPVNDKEFLGTGGPCPGDSGSGAYLPEYDVLFGVFVRGAGKCSAAIFARLLPWEELIRKSTQLAASDGAYPVPAWAVSGSNPDGDGIYRDWDNCPDTENLEQKDSDGDGTGDACETSDSDDDGVSDDSDNCVETPNPDQKDTDGDGSGDACEEPDSTLDAETPDAGDDTGTPGSDADAGVVHLPEDDGDGGRRGCSTAADERPIRAVGFALFALLTVAARRRHRRRD